ncbi:MAG: PhoU domain-containing protein [Synechococcus sp. SB0667_bin_8]|nr:PhoU domain-containing protein [Synechococcus sp. SB0667_bin_8]
MGELKYVAAAIPPGATGLEASGAAPWLHGAGLPVSGPCGAGRSQPGVGPQVRLEDNRIDCLYKNLEERCLFFLSHRRPNQQETRQLIVYLQAIRDLERIGDYCKDLSTTGERLLPYRSLAVRDGLLTMLARSRSLLAMALAALSCHDASAGQRLTALDDLVDQDYVNIYDQLTKGSQLQSMPREAVVMTQAAQGHKPRSAGRCPSPEKVLRPEWWRESQALAPTTDAAGLAESLNACGAAGKTGLPALGNEAGTHLKEEAASGIREGIPALQGGEEVNALASRSLERLADHAVNVSRRISQGAAGADQP